MFNSSLEVIEEYLEFMDRSGNFFHLLFRFELAGLDFFEGAQDFFVQIDVFDPGNAENGYDQVAELLLVTFVPLGGEIKGFAAVLGQVGAGDLPYFFGQRKQENGAIFFGIALAPVDPTKKVKVFGKG